MSQSKRIAIAVLVFILIVGTVIGIETWRGQQMAQSSSSQTVSLQAGSIPIFIDDQLTGGFVSTDLEAMSQVSFVDTEEGKTQEGWLLGEVLLRYTSKDDFDAETLISVSSSSREKTITLSWAEVSQVDNMVLFDMSGRGTLKLVSAKIERFDSRDEWVQDVDKIEIVEP